RRRALRGRRQQRRRRPPARVVAQPPDAARRDRAGGPRAPPRAGAPGARSGARHPVVAARTVLPLLCGLPPPDLARDPGGRAGAGKGVGGVPRVDLARVVDLAAALDADARTDPEALRRRDRAFGRDLAARAGDATARVAAWLDAHRTPGGP